MALTQVQQGMLTTQAQYTGFKNRIINGGMKIDQRNAGASQTITAAAALAYTIDRWYAYCTGANVTGQRVAGSGNNQYNYQFTGAASVTAINFAQRIESLNSYDLAGQTCTLSVNLSNSLLTTVTWTAYYANTADTFGTVASPTVTSIATGTFTVNSTLTNYSVNIAIPSAATTGIQILFSVGAQVSGTWVINNAQFEVGSTATSFDVRPYGIELALCQRYFYKTYNQSVSIGTSTFTGLWSTTLTQSNQGTGYIETQGTPSSKVIMRTSPTITVYDSVGNIGKASYYNGSSLINNYPWTLNAAAESGFSWYSDNSTTKGGVAFHYTSSAEL
jgi:hypothetical protein